MRAVRRQGCLREPTPIQNDKGAVWFSSLRGPAPTCSTCRPTAPISTRSSSSLPSSKRYCARRPRAPKRLYGKPPASCSIW